MKIVDLGINRHHRRVSLVGLLTPYLVFFGKETGDGVEQLCFKTFAIHVLVPVPAVLDEKELV